MDAVKSHAEVRTRSLADYQYSSLKVVEISQKHKVSVPTLSKWVREEGVRRRPRGRRCQAQPSAKAQAILTFAAEHGFSDAARHFNATKQYVSSLGKRWGVAPAQTVPTTIPSPAAPILNGRVAKPRRETVISFRLGASQVAALMATMQPSITESTRSVHKLMRAALLQRIEALKQP
jgi:hypothetical protein